jgi:hypothetical protein
MSSLKNMVETIVASIVDNPDRVSILHTEQDDGSVLIQIQVSKEDAGKLIGRKGRIAGALRTISKAAGAKLGVKVMLNVHKDPLPDSPVDSNETKDA